MDKNRVNIAIIEPSHIIFEGISNVLMKFKKDFYLYRFNDLDELKLSASKENFNVAVINPSAIQNRLADFVKLKNNCQGILWIALVYSFFDDEVLQKYDDTLSVNASPEQIFNKIDKNNPSTDKIQQEDLSEREIEVLVQMVKGLANKEIADKLNISIHTVISHRKNITDKTGIKSLSGLTIYAITKKIIPLDYNSI
ncbi:MAG TPA: LuxR C-terminal-related transcriptional regulator [Draconibacterium sp.]|nr:LuxR C-terminal-related transcriptional regulator [Draconibacterium sp.]